MSPCTHAVLQRHQRESFEGTKQEKSSNKLVIIKSQLCVFHYQCNYYSTYYYIRVSQCINERAARDIIIYYCTDEGGRQLLFFHLILCTVIALLD
jgi:hypothetical protein